MLRALLAPFVLFVATAALSGCGLFEFGTLEFLPSDGSTSMGPEGPQDLATETTDGGTTPQTCTPVVLKTFANEDVKARDELCWEKNKIEAKSVSGRTAPYCDIRFNPFPVMTNNNYVLKIIYDISGVETSPQRSLSLSPRVMDLPPDIPMPPSVERPAPYFDFMPNPRDGLSQTAEIPFQSTRGQFDLALGFQYNILGLSGKTMTWKIRAITLSTVCPK